jgi:diacylglycerol O-acyltransferase
MVQRLSGLDAALLASESSRVPLHSLALWILDPSTVPGGYSFERLRDGILNGTDALPRLHGRIAEVPYGLAAPSWVEARVEPGLHVDRVALPSPGGPRQLARLAAERAERLLDRSLPLWHVSIIEGLASGSIGVLCELHPVPVDGTWAADLAGRLGSGSPESLPELSPDITRNAPATEGRIERLTEALPDIAAQPLRLARAGARAARAWVEANVDGDPGASPVASPVPHPALNRRSSARRATAHTSLRMATLGEIAERAETSWREVVLAALAGALRRELEKTEGVPPDPLIACVIDGVPANTSAHESTHTRLPAVARRRLYTELPQASARLSQIAAASHESKPSDHPSWPGALSEVVDAASPLMLGWLAAAAADLRPRTSAAPPFHVLVSFLEGPGKRTFIAGARLEHVHPLHPIIEGVNLHVAACRGEAAVDVGIQACRRFMPDVWPLAAALSDAVAELSAPSESLAASGR